MKLLFGQSGGPTAAINASLAGAVGAGVEAGARCFGMRYGIEGFLANKSVALDPLLQQPLNRELLCHTPASWLGSCRYKLADPEGADTADYEKIFTQLEAQGFDGVFYLGGNDSMDTIAKLDRWGTLHGSACRFVGIPKTIDNDLVGIDHTPGFGSAAKFVATSVAELALDANVYDLKNIVVVEIMGRDAGWLAASAALAGAAGGAGPDLVLVPEVAYEPEQLAQAARERLAHKNTLIIAASEGIHTAEGTLFAELAGTTAERDGFGHLAATSGAGRWLASYLKQTLGVKTRAVELSTLQRCSAHCASAQDLHEAAQLGATGVSAALAGQTGVMATLTRTNDTPYTYALGTCNVHEVANKVRRLPAHMITSDGMGVTASFIQYAAPLIAGEPSLVWPEGIPAHLEALPYSK